MQDKIINKVLTIQSWEKDDKQIKLTDTTGERFKFWLKKADGKPTVVAQQFKDMDLDNGATVRIGYVIEKFDWKGKQMESNKIITFQETSDAPVAPQTQKFDVGKANSPKKDITYQEDKTDDFWAKKGLEKCLWNYWLAGPRLHLMTKAEMDVVWEVFKQIGKDANARFAPQLKVMEDPNEVTDADVEYPNTRQDEMQVEDIPF